MVFNSGTAANDYNFGAQMKGRRVFLWSNKTERPFFLAIVGNFLQRSYEFSLYLKPFT